LTAEQVEQMVKEVKQVVEQVAQNLRFSVDESTGRTVITVTDAATREVIRQIPSEEMLAVARAIDKLQGLLLHKEA
jgi:flagellar protein FlaG